MPHRNAPLTELGRLRLAGCIVDQGWPVARAAERFQVSRTTAHRWAQRYQQQGGAGMADRSSRPTARRGGPRRRSSAGSSTCAGRNGWGRPRSPHGSAWPPRPCMPSWSAVGSAAWPTWTGPPASQSVAMNATTPGLGPHRHQEAGQHPGRGRPSHPWPPAGRALPPGRPVNWSVQCLAEPAPRLWLHPRRGR